MIPLLNKVQRALNMFPQYINDQRKEIKVHTQSLITGLFPQLEVLCSNDEQ